MCPGACLGGMAGQCPRGQLDATQGGLHRGTTGSTATGASTGVLTHTEVSSETHSRSSKEIRRGVRSARAERRFSEWDPAMDLLGKEAADWTVRWRWNRALGRVFRPRWRRRWSPELAGAARRRRRRSSRQRERGGWDARVRGWDRSVVRPRPESAGLAEPSGPVWPAGQLGQQDSWAKKAVVKLI
jgi:hypothetical protein